MLGRAPFLACALVMLTAAVPCGARQRPDATAGDPAERTHQREGEALIAIADAAMDGRTVPSGITLLWHNDFFKAQQGTFVPFVVTIDTAALSTPSVLLYVRLAARPISPAAAEPRTPRRSGSAPHEGGASLMAVEQVYPVELRQAAGPVRVSRGFSAQAGDYDLVVVVRERVDPRHPREPRRAGVLSRRLTLPDFPPGELNTSSVILADRLTTLEKPVAAGPLEGRPYVIGLSEIEPAADTILRRDEELIVVFLVYNPFVTPERKFDIEVEYHFYTRAGDAPARDGRAAEGVGRPPARDGERYFNHTKPQRFTPAIMGPQFDPSAGHPLMAGQGVPLASFPAGEYRLAIKVTDIVTGKSILRDVTFTIVA